MEELERKTEEKIIRKKELRRKIKEKLSFTTEKYRKEADRKITESILKLEEYQSAGCVFCYAPEKKWIHFLYCRRFFNQENVLECQSVWKKEL